MLLCLNSIQRSQWIAKEKLSYPIAQLPIEMTKSGFFNQKLLWIGFSVVALIQILNGLHFLFPFVPRIPLKISNFGSTVFTTKPWNAIGWLPLFFYPWVIGLTFFVPLDLSFSVWFFFLLTKSQLVIGLVFGGIFSLFLLALCRTMYVKDSKAHWRRATRAFVEHKDTQARMLDREQLKNMKQFAQSVSSASKSFIGFIQIIIYCPRNCITITS
jgi:hypothetical protein